LLGENKLVDKYNIYCDESCWMRFDDTHVIAWGAIWCPSNKVSEIHRALREIKSKHGLPVDFEVKWNKVSIGKIDFYSELVSYFFAREDLYYRGLIAPDKSILDHISFNQTHNDWYYKMYFDLLKVIIDPKYTPEASFNIYFDLTDKWQPYRLRQLNTVFKRYLGDYTDEIVLNLQGVESKEVGIIQIVDLITGAITYANRGLNTNEAKLEIIEIIRRNTNLSLKDSTSATRKKFNLLVWRPKA